MPAWDDESLVRLGDDVAEADRDCAAIVELCAALDVIAGLCRPVAVLLGVAEYGGTGDLLGLAVKLVA